MGSGSWRWRSREDGESGWGEREDGERGWMREDGESGWREWMESVGGVRQRRCSGDLGSDNSSYGRRRPDSGGQGCSSEWTRVWGDVVRGAVVCGRTGIFLQVVRKICSSCQKIFVLAAMSLLSLLPPITCFAIFYSTKLKSLQISRRRLTRHKPHRSRTNSPLSSSSLLTRPTQTPTRQTSWNKESNPE